MALITKQTADAVLVLDAATGAELSRHTTPEEATAAIATLLLAEERERYSGEEFSKSTAKERRSMPLDSFGDPERRLFPIMDQSDVDDAAKLIGKAQNPAAVKRRIIAIAKRKGFKIPEAWQAKAKMSAGEGAAAVRLAEFDLTGPTWTDGDTVYRSGLIFRAGSYPDKDGFEISPEEMAVGAALDAPIELDSMHYESVFDGKLGKLVATDVAPDGESLLGVTALPKWLHDVLGPEPIKVSTTWNLATKTLCGLALVTDPRVSGAALMTAFSAAHPAEAEAFARARHDTPHGQAAVQRLHDQAAQAGAVCKAPSGAAKMASAHESKGIQAIHDTAVEHGATCSAMAEGDRAPSFYPSYYSRTTDTERPASPARRERKPMTLQQRIMALFGKIPDEEWDAALSDLPPTQPPATAPPTAPPATAASPPAPPPEQPAAQGASFSAEVERMRAEFSEKLAVELKSRDEKLAAAEATFAEERKRRADAEAERFADGLIRDAKALPAEKTTLIALFQQAAEDDQREPREITFAKNADGSEVKGGRVALLTAHYQSRPCHGLFSEFASGKIPANVQVLLNQDAPRGPQPDEAQKRQMLEATESGRALIAQMAANGKGGG